MLADLFYFGQVQFLVRLNTMHKISAVIITFNEERNISRCLDSLQGIVDEIVVVDSYSTDRTQELVENSGARFIQNTFEGHIEQKNYALSQASHDWVLSLDADEALSDQLKDAIRQVKTSINHDGYTMNRLSNYCGHWIRHGSWYPDTKLRLFDRTKIRWTGVNPHDKASPITTATVSHLKGDLLHFTYYTIEEHVRKLDYFSSIAAKAYFQKKKPAHLWDLWVRPGFAFFRDFILRGGFLDGYYGWVIARFTAHYTFQKYVKLRFLYEEANKKAH